MYEELRFEHCNICLEKLLYFDVNPVGQTFKTKLTLYLESGAPCITSEAEKCVTEAGELKNISPCLI